MLGLVSSKYPPSFPETKRDARLRLPGSLSLGPRFPHLPGLSIHLRPSVLCKAQDCPLARHGPLRFSLASRYLALLPQFVFRFRLAYRRKHPLSASSFVTPVHLIVRLLRQADQWLSQVSALPL